MQTLAPSLTTLFTGAQAFSTSCPVALLAPRLIGRASWGCQSPRCDLSSSCCPEALPTAWETILGGKISLRQRQPLNVATTIRAIGICQVFVRLQAEGVWVS